MTKAAPKTQATTDWEAVWWQQLYIAERLAAKSLAKLIVQHPKSPVDAKKRKVGILPAVYFPDLRLGSVLFDRWADDAEAVKIGFPWPKKELPPPFGTYVPEFDAKLKLDVRLISRVAAVVRDPPKSDASAAKIGLVKMPNLGIWCGTSSWESFKAREARGDSGGGFILDSDYLENDGNVAATTVIYLLPSLDTSRLTFVPLFYLQSDATYDLEETEKALKTALIAGDTNPADTSKATDRTLWRAVSAVGQLARLRAETWLNKKTGLLSRDGLEAIQQDLQHRALQGHSFAEVFFDLDHFKAMNDRLSYERADDVARAVADAVTAYAHEWLNAEYHIWLEKTEFGARAARLEKPTSPLQLWRPDAFRAFVAHVSGDEFKLYVRTDDTIATRQPPAVDADAKDAAEETALRDFAGGLIASVRALAAGPTKKANVRDLFPPGSVVAGVHESINARRILEGPKFQARIEDIWTARLRASDFDVDDFIRELSISVGIARLRVLRSTIGADTDFPLDEAGLGALSALTKTITSAVVPTADRPPAPSKPLRAPMDMAGLLALRSVVRWVGQRFGEKEQYPTFTTARKPGDAASPLSAVLHQLDIRAERALDGAKKRGRNRMMMFDTLLQDGGAVVEPRGQQVRISLGEQDFVQIGDEFDVFAQSIRVDANSAQAAREARRFYRETPPWMARIKVHKVWSREAMAHVIAGNPDEIEQDYWLRWDGNADERNLHLVIAVKVAEPERVIAIPT